jgi:hypothetical protein
MEPLPHPSFQSGTVRRRQLEAMGRTHPGRDPRLRPMAHAIDQRQPGQRLADCRQRGDGRSDGSARIEVVLLVEERHSIRAEQHLQPCFRVHANLLKILSRRFQGWLQEFSKFCIEVDHFPPSSGSSKKHSSFRNVDCGKQAQRSRTSNRTGRAIEFTSGS